MDDLVKVFVSGYAEDAKPQSIESTKGDFQLTQMRIVLNEIVRTKEVGRIIDIGCGNGALLYVLNSMGIFGDYPNIKYYGFDFDDQIMIAIQESMRRGIFNKANFRTLQDNWSNNMDEEKTNIIVMRNVFHELTIEQLVKYFFEFSCKLREKDFIVFQDTTTLLAAEKGRAGWKGASIEKILNLCGFKTILTPDVSKKDISVFTVKAYDKKVCKITADDIRGIFLKEREIQLGELLTVFESIVKTKGISDITIARVSHDILSIKKQLGQGIDEGSFEAVSLLLYYALMVINKEPDYFNKIKNNYKYFEVAAFQNRGTPLKIIYSFLADNKKKVMEINGSKLIGKKSLIYHALKRFKHNRVPVFIECNSYFNITNILENIIETLEIVRYFDVELISEFGQLTMKGFKEHNVYIDEFEKIVPEVIIVLCNVESLLSPESIIENEDIYEFIKWWSSLENAKIFIDSDRKINWDLEQNICDNIVLSFFPYSADTGNNAYGKYRFVIQYFQETIPAGYLGLDPTKENFADQLFECVNNHPYLAYLAGKVIIQRDNPACLVDKDLVKGIIEIISNDFVTRFEIDKNEKGIIYVFSLCDGFFEKEVIDNMGEYQQTIKKLLDKGILYSSGNEYYKLLPFFTRSTLNINNDIKHNFIKYMEKVYTELYNKTSKPKYFRLVHLYNILGKSKVDQKLSYLLPELSKGAEEFYRDREYALSLSIFKTIKKKRELTSKQEMQYANALIRSNHIGEGLEVYKEIFDKYPTWEVAKLSCVDSLIFVEDKLDFGLQLLGEISQSYRNTYYYRLLGDIYKIKQEPEKVFHNYDIALERMRNYDEGIKVLIKGISYTKELGNDVKQQEYFGFYHKMSINYEAIDIEYASYLEKKGVYDESEKILKNIYDKNPSNVYAIYAYVKTLCSLSQYNKAEKIINDAYENKNVQSDNVNLIDSAKVHYLICNNKYDEAIDLLQAEINKEKKNIHLYGQWADLYYKYYLYKQDKRLIDIGLKYYPKIINTTNVPAMVSCKMLAKEKGDLQMIEKLENRIKLLNCNFCI